MKLYPLSVLTKTDVSKVIKKNSIDHLIDIKVPSNMKVYLQLLEIDAWYPNTEIVVYMDGEEIYRYTRSGRFVYDPPYIISKELRISVVNNSDEDKPFGVFVDGIVVDLSH